MAWVFCILLSIVVLLLLHAAWYVFVITALVALLVLLLSFVMQFEIWRP